MGTNSNTQTISLSTKSNEKVLQKLTTHASHPSIPGFEYSYGFLEQLKSSRAEGYFYYDLDVYFSQFTDVSRLYLIHVSSNFTLGSIAAYNGESNFDAGYNLWSGYIHIYAYQQIEGGKRSSSFTYIKSVRLITIYLLIQCNLAILIMIMSITLCSLITLNTFI
ncbi:MAG: hypothetical protein J6I69_01930 [Bacilli bacterium]|nr:hypothetical protein [Bacilli bacterium]